MFPVGAAAIFLVNRPCIARHRAAKTVIAGFAPARDTPKVSSPGLTRRSIEMGQSALTANSVCSLPPCGGGVGRGVVVGSRDVSANTYPHPQPLPTRGRGAHRVSREDISSHPAAPRRHSPRHLCEITGNLGLCVERSRPRRLYV